MNLQRHPIKTRDRTLWLTKPEAVEYGVQQIIKLANKDILIIKSPAHKAKIEAAVRGIFDAYADQKNDIKHFDRTHFTGVTIGGRKFLYCPVGNICSWSEGDYDNKWCHYEKKFFTEIAQS